jgi:hypothetical protein
MAINNGKQDQVNKHGKQVQANTTSAGTKDKRGKLTQSSQFNIRIHKHCIASKHNHCKQAR